MLVYRICDETEVALIFQNKCFTDIGVLGYQCGPNNHHYEDGFLYMHFFGTKSSVVYHNLYGGLMICTYDIPDELLASNIGLGDYPSMTNPRGRVYLNEFAIKSVDMKFEFLKKIEKIDFKFDLNNIVDYDQYLETIYEEPGFVSRERKKD